MSQIATTPENLAKINSFAKAIEDTFINLAFRWKDERAYEDIADYQKVFDKLLPAGFSIVKMTKIPFGFKFQIGTEATYSLFLRGRTYGWSRIS